MPTDIELLRIFAEDATQGEWKMVVGPPATIDEGVGSTSMAIGGTVYATDPENSRERYVVATWTHSTANARFIAAASPRVVMELCSRIEKLEEERKTLLEALDHFRVSTHRPNS